MKETDMLLLAGGAVVGLVVLNAITGKNAASNAIGGAVGNAAGSTVGAIAGGIPTGIATGLVDSVLIQPYKWSQQQEYIPLVDDFWKAFYGVKGWGDPSVWFG